MSASASSSIPPSEISPTWPLTTIFKPPASCLPPLVSWNTCTQWHIQNSAVLVCGPNTDANACLPTSFYTNAQTPTFSPGVCPNGYTIATTMTEGVAAVSTVPASLLQTTSLCCPSGLTYRPSIYTGIYNLGVCFTTLTTAGTPVSKELSQGRVGYVTTNIYKLPQNVSPQTVVLGYQSPLTVVWASKDLATFTPSSAPLSAAAATTTTSLISINPPASSTANGTHTAAASLSSGAKAGIGVGAAIAVILAIVGVVAWILWRRRQYGKMNKDKPLFAMHELNGANHGYSELETHEPKELDAKRDPAELPLEQRHELPGNFDGHEVS